MAAETPSTAKVHRSRLAFAADALVFASRQAMGLAHTVRGARWGPTFSIRRAWLEIHCVGLSVIFASRRNSAIEGSTIASEKTVPPTKNACVGCVKYQPNGHP